MLKKHFPECFYRGPSALIIKFNLLRCWCFHQQPTTFTMNKFFPRMLLSGTQCHNKNIEILSAVCDIFIRCWCFHQQPFKISRNAETTFPNATNLFPRMLLSGTQCHNNNIEKCSFAFNCPDL